MDSSQEKFEKLDDLIQEYSNLIEKNTDRLGIHIEFEKYENRSQKIIKKIDEIKNTKDEKDKIRHIVEFTIYSGAKSKVRVEYKGDTLEIDASKNNYIHSYSNAARLPSALINTSVDKDKLTGENILKYGELIINVLEYFGDEDNIKKTSSDFWEENPDYDKSFLNNTPKAPFDELKFWYFAANKEDTKHFDTFPLVNGSLTTAIKYLKSIYSNPNDKVTIENIHDELSKKLKDKDINLPVYLYLDQLCNLIHKLKPNEIKKENIKDGKNRTEIFEFYQKLWNTIQPAKQRDLQKELNKFKNIIYHGAPGTGKTYQLKEEVNEHISIQGGGKYEFIQFHGSYYYEDFIGGLKPIDGKNLTLKYKNGIFKQLCKEAAKYEIAYYKLLGNDEELIENTEAPKDITLNIDDNPTIVIKKGQNVLSQFPPFFIIIDEINRADLSKVFGELLFAIEDDYRGYKHKFKLSSSNMEDKDTAVCWENGEAYFFVPKNLYIRGTMNDIDKSVDSIDFAFRRRFKWIEKKFDKNMISEIIGEKCNRSLDLGDYLNKCSELNNKITNEISIADESFKIGHAIFANIIKYLNSNNEISKTSKEQLFDNHIEPILYNYLKMDYGNSIDINDFKKVFIS